MIGIFILLFIAMLLVMKFCKKVLKVVLGIVIILITIYCVILNIDMNMVKTCREPIFAKENGHMGSMIRYDGLGYKVGLEKNSKGDITDGQLTILDFYLTQVHRQIDYIDPTNDNENIVNNIDEEENNVKTAEIKYMNEDFEEIEVNITNKDDIEKLEEIFFKARYDRESCEGIITHTITINNEKYYVLESCKEISNNNGKQALISNKDLDTIKEIINAN